MMTLADFFTVFWVVSDSIHNTLSYCSSRVYLCANATHDCGSGRIITLSRGELEVQDVRLRDCVP